MAPNGSELAAIIEDVNTLKQDVSNLRRWAEMTERLSVRVLATDEALRGTGETAGLTEKVDAILRFLGGTVVVRPQRREVVVERSPSA